MLEEDHTDDSRSTVNSQNPFLRLPQELKNRIYELVLGEQLLHVKRDWTTSTTKKFIKEQRFTNQICSSQISEKGALDCFKTQKGSNLFVDGIELRHSNCYPSKDKSSSYSPDRMNINLLHTCRQIYNEARFIPYSTNTFSFDTPRNLRAFIHLLTQKGANLNQAIRILHINVATTYGNTDLRAWTQALKAVVQHMTLLEKVYVNLDQWPTWPTISVDRERYIDAMQPVLNCLAILGKTSTPSIEIIVSDQHLSNKFGGSAALDPGTQAMWAEIRWTLEEKRKWVEKVKLAIRASQLLV